MSVLAWILAAGAAVCAITLTMTVINLANYARARRDLPAPAEDEGGPPVVSVCVPARNEEANLEACVRSLLASRGISLEVLAYDDQSTDATPAILRRLEAEDPRVRSVPTQNLMSGWNGKQFACDQMGRRARGRWVLFTDADVRFGPDCLRLAVAEAEARGVALLSTFPRQETGTLAERLAVPMIHFILLSYLPMARMRRTTDPAASAGCGQFLLARRAEYLACGGHGAFADTMHDGIRMPRTFRSRGLRTDLVDLTDHVSCRMYRGLGQTWRGFAKNAYEGLGSIGLLMFLTVMHGLGHVLPWIATPAAVIAGAGDAPAVALGASAIGMGATQRVLLARRFDQSAVGVVLHPLAVLMMTAIQWHSLVLAKTGRREWRGRRAGGVSSARAA